MARLAAEKPNLCSCCWGTGKVKCQACKGGGYEISFRDAIKFRGQGTIARGLCPRCKGTRQDLCRNCGGTGSLGSSPFDSVSSNPKKS
eukprot:tig00000444_g800.t1